MEFIRSRKSKLSIDMTPMIDVVFQLLVFFMLTSTFVNPNLKLDLPKAVTNDPTIQQTIIISIDKDGGFYLNDTPIHIDVLKPSLIKAFEKYEKKTVYIRGDEQTHYKNFVKVVDIARQAGAVQVNLMHSLEESH